MRIRVRKLYLIWRIWAIARVQHKYETGMHMELLSFYIGELTDLEFRPIDKEKNV